MRVERALVGLMLLATAAATGCGRLAYNIPPASRLMEPGPGVGGPGPGVIPPAGSPYGLYGGAIGRYGDGMGGAGGAGMGAPCGPSSANNPRSMSGSGVVPASYNCPCEQCGPSSDGYCEAPCDNSCPSGGCPCDGGGCMDGACCMRPGSTEAYADGAAGAGGGFVGMATSQIAFLGDDGVQVSWDVSGSGMFDSTPLVIPGRQDFYQAAIYRLKLTNIPGRAGVVLYPTLEVAPVTPRTDAYLAHSPIPVQFTEEDFDQVVSGNFVTKVIYLPDPEFQELALAGVETLVSTRLDPGVDPIAEADRRGSILAILRMGNKDLELGGGGASNITRPQTVIPASTSSTKASYPERTVAMQQPVDSAPAENLPSGNEVMAAPYHEDMGPAYEAGPSFGGVPCTSGEMANMPMGMPTSGFAPPNVPPNMIAGGPQWGMPITGTPIGLPGPPHVPLGSPAGLQKHVMTNRTRVMIPPPVSKVHLSVKQRPGLNYPRPVNHAYVDETQREPIRILPNWFTAKFHRNQGGGNFGGTNYGDGQSCPQ